MYLHAFIQHDATVQIKINHLLFCHACVVHDFTRFCRSLKLLLQVNLFATDGLENRGELDRGH